jgi:pimeloyl-ACP methyl ester carboxylesterase
MMLKCFTNKAAYLALAFGLILTLAVPACRTDQTSKGARGTEMITDSVPSADGVMITYDVRGEGTPALVFVHCWSCDRSYWSSQVDEFAKTHTVVTLDLAGHGQSGTNRAAWTIPAFGADVAAVVNKLGLDSVILIGHSMGGPVIVEAARLLPGKVLGLVGVDTYVELGQTYTPEQIEAYLAPLKQDFKTSANGFVRSMFPPNADTALAGRVAEDMSSAPPDIALGAFQAILAYVYTEPPMILTALKEVNLPVRCVVAEVNATKLDGIRNAVPSFGVKVMSGVGHFLHLEAPETFNKYLQETIDQVVSLQVGKTK